MVLYLDKIGWRKLRSIGDQSRMSRPEDQLTCQHGLLFKKGLRTLKGNQTSSTVKPGFKSKNLCLMPSKPVIPYHIPCHSLNLIHARMEVHQIGSKPALTKVKGV